MPSWLQNQLQRAFLCKDRRQIHILNDCWFKYSGAQAESERKKNYNR